MVSVSVYDGIVEVEVTKFITMDDVILDVHEYINSLPSLPSEQLMLIDATQCRTNIGLSDLGRLKNTNKLLTESFEMLKVAIVLDDPLYTAICMVYQNMMDSERFCLRVFSTRSGALRWLR
ncbi:hypothetical protein SAMN06265379_102361 [Saccharicrinis carchari]|uniref:SpoIIAA-like n=1 Tax=Saccharicrinis carchari TaxID=1168039 RepID=A0A521C5F4_SACCC|nr:hypothetical protein [Saccharicrinis carchari]SMO54061.1 hypothetical protein SAMN06265379_102361 [Saccharicrinis carchari]